MWKGEGGHHKRSRKGVPGRGIASEKAPWQERVCWKKKGGKTRQKRRGKFVLGG
jgi:hypothetical protein